MTIKIIDLKIIKMPPGYLLKFNSYGYYFWTNLKGQQASGFDNKWECYRHAKYHYLRFDQEITQ